MHVFFSLTTLTLMYILLNNINRKIVTISIFLKFGVKRDWPDFIPSPVVEVTPPKIKSWTPPLVLN